MDTRYEDCRADRSVDFLGALPTRLSALARQHRVPGAQLAIYHDGVTTASEVGELEFRTGRPVTRDTAFAIGSITKCFTATVAMILVADGDVELDAPIEEYVPELGGLGVSPSLRQLLSHTSGLADSCDFKDASTSTLRRYVADRVRRENFVLPPGAAFSYSNPGYAVAGRLIETITGMSWSEAVESILLRPLGVEPAFVAQPGTNSPRRPLATGHSVNAAVGRTRPVQQSAVPASIGALAMSAVDLVKLGLIHAGPGAPELLPAADAAQMRQAVADAEPFGLADGWGLGLAVYRADAGEWVGHDGNADGTSCYLRINPADGWVIALTANANTGAGLWQDLLDELARASVPIAPAPAPAPVAAGLQVAPARGCAGWFANGEVEYHVTAGSNGSVHMSVDGENFVPLTFHDEVTFSLIDPASGRRVLGGRFVREPATGKVYGVQAGGRLAPKQLFLRTAPWADDRLAPAG
jgi:CubicO group peptidase (beta-lactamase class C family)